MNRVLLVCLFLLGALVGRPAAAATIEEYRAQIDLRDPDVARYTLYIDYVTQDGFERKHDGFKFLGEGAIRNLKLIDSPGATVDQAYGFVEERVDFTLSVDNDGDPDPISFSFERDPPSGARSWASVEYDLPWVSMFQIGIERSSIVLLVPPDWSVSGFDCKSEGDHNVCERTAMFPDPVIFSVTRRGDLAWNTLGLFGALLLLAAGFIFGGRWAKRTWIEALGILPVLHEPPAPTLSQSYRAPAPLPVDTELEPVLADEDQAKLQRRLHIAFGIALAGLITLAVLIPGHVGSPPWLWFLLYGLFAAGTSTLTAGQNSGWQKLPVALALAFAAYPLFNALDFLSSSDLLPYGIVFGVIILFFKPLRGSSSDNGSTFFSSSSCGGGGCGSGCGGGGGCGGGCGGCGG